MPFRVKKHFSVCCYWTYCYVFLPYASRKRGCWSLVVIVVVVVVVVGVFGRGERSGFIDCGKGFPESRDVGFSGVESHDDGFGVEVALEVFDTFLVGDVPVDFVDAALTMKVHIKRHGLLFGLGKSSVTGHECGAKRQKK